MSKLQATFCFPDLQIPHHDRALVDSFLKVIEDLDPDRVLITGDFVDLEEVSRWSKGKPGEYSGTLGAAIEEANQVLDDLENVISAETQVFYKEGNHDRRLADYIRDYAPALIGIDTIEAKLKLDERGFWYHKKPFHITADVKVFHGHESSYSSVQGKWERDRILNHGMSVVTGHTHSPTLITQVIGPNHYFGMNLGHAMNTPASYIEDDWANWTPAFGVLWTDAYGHTTPELVLCPEGRVFYHGKSY